MKKQLRQTSLPLGRLTALILFMALTIAALSPSALAQPLYYSDMQSIFSTYNCNGCHGSSSGLSVNNYNTLLAGGTQCGPAIIPFNANGSPLVTKIDPAIPNCSGGNMPQGGGTVSSTHLSSIKAWIDAGALQSASSPCADLSITAYVEGSSFNKCIEIYNGTGSTKDLTAYSIKVYSNGSPVVSANIPFNGSLAAGAYYLVCHTDADLPGLTPNLFNSNLNFNGNDAVALNNGTLNVDVVGQIGTDPGIDGWLAANGCSTKNQTMLKVNNGNECPYGNFLGTSDFAAAIEGLYTCLPEDDVTMLGSYVPPVEGCPTLNYPTGVTQNITLCPSDETPLSVLVTGNYSDIIWQESGVTVGNGPSIPGTFQNNGCTSIVFDITVTALSSDSTCVAATLNYTITVLPSSVGTANLTYPDACSVCIQNACAGSTFTYTTSTGTTGSGNCYEATPGENVSVTFTISNTCGTATLVSEPIACTPPQTGAIQGYTWFDSDNNGLYDMGTDLLLNNISISLYNADNGQLITQTTSDFTGQYIFDDIPAGNYYLVFAPFAPVSILAAIGADINTGQTPVFTLAAGQIIEQTVGYIQIESIETPTSNPLRLTIAPNPAQNTAALILGLQNNDQPLTIQLYDLAGRCIIQQTVLVTTASSETSYPLDITNLNEGIYIVSIQNGQYFAQQKLMVLKM